jgi:hypothetical protein
MKTVRLPSFVLTGFDAGRYSFPSKSEGYFEIRTNGETARPGLLKGGFVDQIAYFRYEHLH